MRRWASWREDLVLIAGLAGLAYETLAVKVDRPTLLGIFGTMVTAKVLVRRDRHRRRRRRDQE